MTVPGGVGGVGLVPYLWGGGLKNCVQDCSALPLNATQLNTHIDAACDWQAAARACGHDPVGCAELAAGWPGVITFPRLQHVQHGKESPSRARNAITGAPRPYRTVHSSPAATGLFTYTSPCRVHTRRHALATHHRGHRSPSSSWGPAAPPAGRPDTGEHERPQAPAPASASRHGSQHQQAWQPAPAGVAASAHPPRK